MISQQSYPESFDSSRLHQKLHSIRIKSIKRKKKQRYNRATKNKIIGKPIDLNSKVDESHSKIITPEVNIESLKPSQQIYHEDQKSILGENHGDINFNKSQIQEQRPKYHLVPGKKRNKRLYYCSSCSYKSFNICHLKRHRNTCTKVKIDKKPQVDEQQQPFHQPASIQIEEEQQILAGNHNLKTIIKSTLDQLLEQKLLFIGKDKLNLSHINKLTLQIYQTIQKAIRQSVITNIRAVLEQKIMSDPKYMIRPRQLAREILRLVSELDFSKCVLSYLDQLQKAHNKTQDKIVQKTSRTYQNNQRCFQRFKNLTQVDLRNPHRLFDIASSFQKFVREDMRRYFNIVKRQSAFLSDMQDFPIISESTAKRARIIPISYVTAANDIKNIYQQGKKQLAVDMWAIMSLALRADDLLKVRLQTSDGLPIKVIRLQQKKTGSVVDRYIPTSLIQLAFASKTLFPMTRVRLKKAVRQCLNRYKSAYGFKHRAITEIIVSLAQSNKFLNFHRRSSMTFKYYLDKNEERLLDMAFSLGINFIFDEPQLKLIKERKIIFDITKLNHPTFQQIKEEKLVEVTIDCRQSVQQRLVSSALDLMKPDEEVLKQVKEQHLGQIYYLKNQYDIDLQPQSQFRSIQSCIGSICSSSIYQQIQSKVYSKELVQVDQPAIFCRQLENNCSSAVVLAEFQQDIVDPIKVTQINSSQNKSKQSYTLITSISRSNGQTLFKIFPSETIHLKQIRKSKSQALEKMKNIFLQKNKIPKCPNCLKNKKISFLQVKDKQILCPQDSCDYKDIGIKGNQTLAQHKLLIVSTANQYPLPLICPQRQIKKNNLQEAMGNQFSLSNIYSSNVPRRMDSKLLSFAAHMKTIDRFFRIFHYLPYQIRASNIESAGKGVFCTANIEQNTLVGVYTGFVGNHYEINQKSDSLFNLGWYYHNEHWYQIISDGCLSNCGTRFINTNKDSKINVKAFQGVLNEEITVLYIAARHIREGEELFVKYGCLYNLNIQFDSFRP